jgi:hypothetical protein
MNLYEKLIEVRKEVPYLQKENRGEQYNYVSSSQVLGNVKAKLDELKVLLIPAVSKHNVTASTVDFFNDKGQATKHTHTYFTELDMVMTWVNAEKPDEKIECPWYGQGVDIAGEKGVGKALTYAEKYFMLKFFNIPTDKDDPDSFQRRMEDEEPPRMPQNPPQQNKHSGNDNHAPGTNQGSKNDSGANDKATKAQVAEVFKFAKEQGKDIFKVTDELLASGRITTKYPYADKEKTKVNWTQADVLEIMSSLEVPF